MTSIPDYLYSLPSDIPLPIHTNIQELPFNDLTWENFERLTLRYVESVGKLDHCHLYGKAGQKQEGIDLFARHNSDGLYTVYQCKRYKNYSVSNVKSAISTFLEGAWSKKSKNFYICTSCDLSEKNLADEIEVQSKILKDLDINLFVLDKVKFSSKLKILPKIVYDFFGKEWAKQFCGNHYIEDFTNRLDAKEFARYKNKLGKFYGTLFENHEGSISNLSGIHSTPDFEKRYILPDIISNISIDSSNLDASSTDYSSHQLQASHAIDLLDEIDVDANNLTEIKPVSFQDNSNIENRSSALDWIASEKNSIVVGGPGSGKSALLKYVVLGLLEQVDISETSLLQNRHKLIPVWLPFGYWTNYLETTPNASLIECMRSWFKGMDHDDLWPLMESAINDDRLLLIIDGLDEWSSKQTALICLQKLTVFIKERDVSSILSSRPSGIERLGMNTLNWSLGYLTGLSKKQQEELIEICVGYRLKNQLNTDNSILKHETQKVTQELVSEISRSKDLLDLASVPLLIYMLIHLKTKNISLPHSRFEVYKELLFDLVKVQPQRRRTAAQVVNKQNIFSETELISILSKLAYDIQREYPHGNVPLESAKTLINKYLSDESKEFGFNKRDASRYTEEFINIGESEVGILVKKSTDEVGFFHRTLQEFLAAQYISTESNTNQEKLLDTYIFNEQWKDVFIGLFSLLQRNSDIENLVKYINNLKCNEHETMLKDILLVEIAFGDNKCSANTAKNIAQAAFQSVETGNYLPHRQKLLNVILSGYNSNKLHGEIFNRLSIWFPENNTWFTNLFNQIEQHWEADSLTKDLLLNTLEHKDIYDQKAAAKVIVSKFNSDEDTLASLMKLAKNTLRFETRMVASEVIFKGWLGSKEAISIYNSLKSSKSAIAQILRVFYETKSGVINSSNRKLLLRYSEHTAELTYHWNDLISECLMLSYADEDLKTTCIQRIFLHGGRTDIDYDIARDILSSNFYTDDEFIHHYIEDLSNKHSSFLSGIRRESHNIQKIIKYSKVAKEATENWVINNPVLSYDLYWLFKSEKMKTFLLNRLKDGSSFIHWPADALLHNWGMSDSLVKETLLNITNVDVRIASGIAHLYPIIFEDKDTCYRKLVALLETPCNGRKRYDFIVKAILQISTQKQKDHALDILIKKLDDPLSNLNDEDLILLFGMSNITPEILQIASKNLDKSDGNIGLVAAIFRKNDMFRKKIAQKMEVLCAPLRSTIANNLIQQNTEQSVFDLLAKYNLEVDPSVKTLSAIGLYTSPLSTSCNEIKELNYEKLKEELFASGMNHDEVRQAAFCGLTATHCLDRAKDLKDPYSKNIGLRIPTGYTAKPNEVYYSYLVKEWDYIQSILPTSLDELTGDRLDTFFTNLGPHIDSNQDLKKKFNEYIYSAKFNFNERILIAASRVIPGEKRLLEMCLNILGLLPQDKNVPHNLPAPSSLLALHILQQQFFGDEQAKIYLLNYFKMNESRLDTLLVVSTVIGFTDAPFVNEIKIKLKGEPIWLPTHFHNITNIRGHKQKIDDIIKCIDHLTNAPKQYSKYFCSVMSTLINNSDSFSKEVIKHIKAESSAQVKLQLLIIYIHSKGFNSTIKDITIEMYNKQRKKKLPDIIFDASEGSFSIATMALTNLLYKYD